MAEKGKAIRTAPAKGYTIGITIFVKADGSLALFENGLRQNVLFLYLLFKASPNCRRVWLLNHGDGDTPDVPANLGIAADAIVRTADVIDELDYVVGLGAAIDRETVTALKAKGCKIICYKGGNGAVISMEAIVAKPQPRPDAELYFDHDYYDAIWMTPQHIHTYRGWCELIYRCPVYEVPQVWAPLLIETADAEVRKRFGFKPISDAWRIGVLDPNITVMKTSHMPMLVCEAAYRRRPDAFRAMYISNGWPYREDPHFRSFAVSLEASKAGVMTIEPRFVSSHFLANHCDAVVTHQWENGLNYLYYEVLYGGYPLIHNSEFLRDYGYYYKDFDADSGAAALLDAHDHHAERLDDYRKKAGELLARVAPTSPKGIETHERLLAALAETELAEV
ncbi:MAG TPA: DUF2827 family protein [Caulobacteraceae bacterium]|nr:DUF2827 family protein [Caulobacteraceae bacterium]